MALNTTVVLPSIHQMVSPGVLRRPRMVMVPGDIATAEGREANVLQRVAWPLTPLLVIFLSYLMVFPTIHACRAWAKAGAQQLVPMPMEHGASVTVLILAIQQQAAFLLQMLHKSKQVALQELFILLLCFFPQLPSVQPQL